MSPGQRVKKLCAFLSIIKAEKKVSVKNYFWQTSGADLIEEMTGGEFDDVVILFSCRRYRLTETGGEAATGKI